MKRFLILLFAFVFGSVLTNAQTLVKGTVVDADYNSPLVGASVAVKGTNNGTMTDINGNFEISLKGDKVTLQISYVGYKAKEIEVNLAGKRSIDLGDIALKSVTTELNEIYVVAERASEQRTPVALSNIGRRQIDQILGTQDIPLAMNIAPSVYATAQGGGSGDARINVRGFNQRNVAIMINGVPVNDMENGWVYWSNWDGISDATSSIQLQRGMSAVNLAVPSIGGTVNIVTSPAAKKRGAILKSEVQMFNDPLRRQFRFALSKTTITYHTGMINNKFALSASFVRKFGPGVIDGTWTDAWAYYFGATYKVSKKTKIEFYALGAPQRHGQNLYKQNLAAYDSTYFLALGGAHATVAKFHQDARGRFYNENWNWVNPDYTGKQYWYSSTHKRHSPNFINERENYYHKPLVNLNIYNHFNKKVSLFTVLYYSGGKGGGSGTYGHMDWDYSTHPSRVVNWDGTIANNNGGHSAGILRNSVNEQWTLGVLSKLRILFNEHLKANFGIDGRYAKIYHYREVRDLLGGDAFIFTGNELHPEDSVCGLGDKIAYYFTNTVQWFGYYGQAEYSNDKMTAYLTLGNSFVKYQHNNHFVQDPKNPGHELVLKSKVLTGYQIKTGFSYRPIEGLKTYINLGYISKTPIFDNVISDRLHAMAPNPHNEIFESTEIGFVYKHPSRLFDIRGNYYYTLWKDRAISIGSYNEATNQEELIFITGLNELHQGLELEAYLHPTIWMDLSLIGSTGNWIYTNDVSGQYSSYDDQTGQVSVKTQTYYTKGLKVGDAPQTQFASMLTLKPIDGLRLELEGRYYTDYYSNFEPTSRTDENDRAQVWKVPDYYIFDLHASYRFKVGNYNMSVYGHVFNLLNALYVSDATDDSRYNGYYGYSHELSHTVNSAEVFVGLPRTFNLGFRVEF